MPERIRRMRTKGWRMPDSAVSVTRPTRWGNPFRIGVLNPPQWVWQLRRWHAVSPSCVRIEDAAQAVAAYRKLARQPDFIRDARAELAGLDLACWCAVGAPCHGDVLLHVAGGCTDDGCPVCGAAS